MTEDQKAACHGIIHAAATAAAGVGAGLAQVPGGDALLIVPIQIGMIVGLGKVFGVHLAEATAKAVVLSMAGMWVGRGASQLLVGWIPGFGNAINAGTAFSITEAMGWSVASRLERGDLR